MFNVRSWSGRLAACALVALSVGAAAALPGRAEAQIADPAPGFTSDRISVEVTGIGPDVVLIPGMASSREVWRATAEALAGNYRLHLVQLSGFAGQPWTHGEGDFWRPAVAEIARYIETAGLERPAIIGHSMGGASGVLLAQERPDLVGRVMSVDSLPYFGALYGPSVTPETAAPMAEQAVRAVLASDDDAFRAGQEALARGMSRDETTRAAMVAWSMASDRQAMGAAMRDLMTTDLRPGLAAMTTPVWAVYAADADGGAPAAMADAMWAREYADLPDVRLERVDGARHFIMADQPEAFMALVRAFLSE
ncbi:alpha/beta hydrolase [Brevundimonas sp. BAL450]|uniref:Hydrolase, alpha/beta hydrolase fold family n=1 Tax=Brevundimonas abyssalis TAR-001 TaxID=1391729 RepID=A0A8E0NDK0_9CAUL|nr:MULTISPECIES: alpha/beta hydrolase [Brevundimonas]MBG7615535.1 alpha/beta hydrolase [Brevundimonas sp. BAL450]GAD60438.1 hydrolase, alpha/beta hydrolase fold family [Brevundimonas abyssalis TAR-001]